MNKRERCILCGESLFEEPLYCFENMPAESQNLPLKEELQQDHTISFNLRQCKCCGLVQLDCLPVSYYRASTRAGERCDVLIKMRRRQYKHIIETYGLNGGKILEIGSGKGGFLKTLKEMEEYHIDEYGLEFDEVNVQLSRAAGINTQQGNPENEDTIIEGAPFDAFMSFAYPARLVDPNAMLRLAYKNLKEDGIGLIQVASLEHILKRGGFYDVTRDHIAYYSEATLCYLLQKNGFEVLERGEIGEVYVYAIVKKRSPLNINAVWDDISIITEAVREYVDRSTQDGNKLAVWCAGHFAFTVLSLAEIGERVSYIIDNSKDKQGRFSPGSHVPIYGPEHTDVEPINTILILGPFYLEEILDEIRKLSLSKLHIAAVDKTGLKVIQ